MQLTFDSAGDLARALRRAADAHGQHEEQTGHPDPDWPSWYALYLEREQAGLEHELTFPARLDGATVPVAIVNSRTEAELIVGMLRNNDLTAAVSADDAGGLDPALQTTDGVRVLVAPSDEASARRLLAAADDTPSADETPFADDTPSEAGQPSAADGTPSEAGQPNAFQRWMNRFLGTGRS